MKSQKWFNISKNNLHSNFTNTMLQVQSAYFLKVPSATFLLVCFLSLKESTCQTKKNVFYFTSKALSVLEKTKV